MKAALKRLFSKEHAVVSQASTPASQSPAPTAQNGCSSSFTTNSPNSNGGKGEKERECACSASDVIQDEVAVRHRPTGLEFQPFNVMRASWAGGLRHSQTQGSPRHDQLAVGPLGAAAPDIRTSWRSTSSAPRAPRRSMDMAPPLPPCLGELPVVGHLAEADWTRALTGNIKSIAQVHGALTAAAAGSSSSPNSPDISQPSKRLSMVGLRRRQSSAMGYGPQYEAALLQTAPSFSPVPEQQAEQAHQRGRSTVSFDGAEYDPEGGDMEYFADDVDDEGAGASCLPSVVPPALLEEAARAGISLLVDLDSDVALSTEPPLGRGSSGTVLKATYRGQPCAVKMLPHDLLFGSGSAELHTFVQEVVVMAPLRHPNIVACLGGSLQPPHVFLIAELCETSLDAWLHPRGGAGGGGMVAGGPPPPTPRQLLKVALDVATGLQYLHGREPAIVHRDLKAANVLIDANGTAKISDFGLARVKTTAAINTKAPAVGSVGYIAPECFTSELGLLTDKCDMWSLGVLLWEMVTRKRPFAGLSLTEYYREVVVRRARLPIPQDDAVCPLALRRLISSCWCDDPQERPSCGHIVSELTRILKYCPQD